jgi:3-methyladenine DNA glycosylase Tag
MAKTAFQTGISWAVVEAKWPGIKEALGGFDPTRLSAMSPEDVDRLAGDPRMIRNRRKIEALIENAHALLALDGEPGGYEAWLDRQGGFDETVRELGRRFKYLGEFGSYYYLYVTGRPVPEHEEWAKAHRGRELRR